MSMLMEAVTRELDVGGLEPPEPMVRILDTLLDLPPHQGLRVLIDREPVPLYRVLQRHGYAWRCTPLGRRYEVLIWPEADGGADAAL
ncbi:DUF2249 domain-containing protein [Oxalobacteraceae bacterium A2-2]